MIPDLPLSVLVPVHVALGLAGLGAGAIVLLGMLASRVLPGITALFLLSTLATSVTGFLYPSTHFGIGRAVGALSVVVLAPTFAALYVHRLAGAWRWVYAAGATTALWLDAFAGALQAFYKIEYLQPLAGTPIVLAVQAALFAGFAGFGALAVGSFRPEPLTPRLKAAATAPS